MTDITTSINALPAFNADAVAAFSKRIEAFKTLSLNYNYPQREAVQRFHTATQKIEARKNCSAIVPVGPAIAETSWLSTITTADCQRSLATISKGAIALFLGMAFVAACILIGIGMTAVLGYELWQQRQAKRRLRVEWKRYAKPQLIRGARAWVGGISVIAFEGWPVVKAIAAVLKHCDRGRRPLSLYPAQ